MTSNRYYGQIGDDRCQQRGRVGTAESILAEPSPDDDTSIKDMGGGQLAHGAGTHQCGCSNTGLSGTKNTLRRGGTGAAVMKRPGMDATDVSCSGGQVDASRAGQTTPVWSAV